MSAAAPARDPEELLTTEEAAQEMKLSPGTLQNYRIAGNGPRYVKLGPSPRARVRYKRSDISDWLSDKQRTSTTND